MRDHRRKRSYLTEDNQRKQDEVGAFEKDLEQWRGF